MTYEKSCGGIIYTEIKSVRRYLIIQSTEGIYGFPKGHMENDETELETALREVFEETGIRAALIEDFKLTDEHPLPNKKDVMKHITYFVGKYENQEITIQETELKSAKLMTYDEAMEAFQFESSKKLLKDANRFIEGLL